MIFARIDKSVHIHSPMITSSPNRVFVESYCQLFCLLVTLRYCLLPRVTRRTFTQVKVMYANIKYHLSSICIYIMSVYYKMYARQHT